MELIRILLFFILFSVSSAYAQNLIKGQVIEIIDGQTFVLEDNEKNKYKIQLQYIEIPSDENFILIVKSHLERLILNKTIEFQLRVVSNGTNRGKVTLSGIDISKQLLRDGAACYVLSENPYITTDEHKEYQENESAAKTDKIGFWGNIKLALSEESFARKQLRNESFINGRAVTANSIPQADLGESSNSKSNESSESEKTVYVKGYTRKDGTYVPPHTRRPPSKKP